jgi:hypothetical protein
MLRHTFVFLAFSLTLCAGQAGTAADTGSAAQQANAKKPAQIVKTSTAVKQAPQSIEGKKTEVKVSGEPKAAAQPKPAPSTKAVDSTKAAVANAKTAQTQAAANTKSAAIKPAPAVKTAETKPASTSKTAVIKPAPAAKTAQEKKETDKSKTAKGEGQKETGRAEHVREQRIIRAGLVPPPPPETPAVLSAPDGSNGFYMMQGFLPVETLSPDALRARQKQLTSQLQNVKDILKDRQSRLSDKTDRAKQFDGLYQEGVISRRELEASQEDIKTAQRDFDDAKSRVDDLQMALNRVSDKLKAIAKYGTHPNKRFAAGDRKRSKTKAADVSAQAASVGGTKTALKPASLHQSYGFSGSTAQPAPSAISAKSTTPAASADSTSAKSATPAASADSTSADGLTPVMDAAAKAAPVSQVDASSQLAPPGPAQAAR